MLVKGEDIIVITADGTGGLPRSGNLDAVQLWYGPGLQLLLNLAGARQLPSLDDVGLSPKCIFKLSVAEFKVFSEC